jgi:hypothetical protein
MKIRYRLFRRGNRYYMEDTDSGRQTSLQTKSRSEALRLVAARNDATAHPALRLALGRAYLSTLDPRMVQRTWREVFEAFAERGKEQTQERRRRAARSPAFRGLLDRKLVETTGDDLREVLRVGGASTNLFLRCLHNQALGMGWLPAPIIPPKLWASDQTEPQARNHARRARSDHCERAE